MIRNARPALKLARLTDEPAGAGGILVRVLQLLDKAGIAYCIPHTPDGFPHEITGDVDMVVPAAVLPRGLVDLLHASREDLGARIVQWLADREHYIVLEGRNPDGSLCFLQLHVGADYVLEHRVVYPGDAMLASARPHRQWRVPAPGVEFACSLARRASKGKLLESDIRRLIELRHDDAAGCAEQARQVFGKGVDVGAILDLNDLRPMLPALRTRMLSRAALRRPVGMIRSILGSAARRAKKTIKLDRGLSVVFLGPDGSGKSSIVRGVAADLDHVFAGTDRQSFPPALRNRGKDMGTSSTPHDVKPRSFLASSIRALGYWFMWERFAHRHTVRRQKMNNRLILHDRHLVDALVDAKRYRYGGPRWLLRAIWTKVPKPDLVILLDVPPEVAYERKREVPVDEIARQREAYRKLVDAMPIGRIVDASAPMGEVLADADAVILDHLATRVRRQFNLEA